jgi:hypothetical protein
MTTLVDASSLRKILLGSQVSRATDTLPQSTDEALFTVTGRVLVTTLIGEVTTVIQTQANNTKLKFNPDGTGADTDLCAVLSITGDAVGTQYSLTGTAADGMTEGLYVLTAAQMLQAPGIFLNDGNIELDCAASNTGSVKWDLTYIPISDDGSVAAA